MNTLSNDALKRLDELITALDPVIGYLNQKVRDKTIKGVIDINRIDNLNSAYNEFMAASNQDHTSKN